MGSGVSPSPEDASTVSQYKLDLEQVQGWLRRLYPPDTPGLVWIGSKSTGFKGARFDPRDLPAMLREVTQRDQDPGVFVRMSTITPEAEKRGTAADSVAVAGFWADIDTGTEGHKHLPERYEGRELPPDQEAAEKLVELARLPEPTAWVASGGGFYPMWLPKRPWLLGTDCTAEQWNELSVDLQTAIHSAATERGWHFGMGTGDIARILRIPGTINRKLPTNPRRCDVLWGGGPNYSFAELRGAIPRAEDAARSGAPWGLGAPPPNRAGAPALMVPLPAVAPKSNRFSAPASSWEETPGAVGPLDDFAARNDLRDLLEADGWTFGYEHAGRRHYARPGKSPKDGVSGNVAEVDGRQVLFVFSEGAGLPTYRGLSAGEWYAWRHHGGDLREAARTLRRAGYGTPPETRLPGPSSNEERPAGASIPAALPALVETVTEDIWGRRPIFTAIRNIAWDRMVGPWAVLGATLAQVACRVGPHMQLPPIVGGPASLNLFVGLVGRSGGGKDAATAVAAELLGVSGRIPKKKLGTGQGIDASYTAQHPKEGPIQYNDVALFTVPEIDSLGAHSQMNGSTLMSTLREVYTGSALGAHYADKFKRRPVGEHRYRAAVLAGIQPARAGVLLDDADGGTPQRWVWMPTNDVNPTPPRRRLVPPGRDYWWVDYEAWMPNGENPDDEPVPVREPEFIAVCRTAWDTIRGNRARILAMDIDSDEEALNGHALLTRLKVAALLGFLERRAEVTDDDWELAGLIMTQSEQTRAKCQGKMRQKHEQTAVARGKARAAQAVAETEEAAKIEEQKIERLVGKIVKKLQTSPAETMTRGKLNAWAGRDRKFLDQALEQAQERGLIAAEQGSNAVHYRAAMK